MNTSRSTLLLLLFLFAATTLLFGCHAGSTGNANSFGNDADDVNPGMEKIAQSDDRWTGVAVSSSGRIFVNIPRWSENVPFSVAELLEDGSLQTYPNNSWNSYNPGGELSEQFVCVQSVYVDDTNGLWILDAGNPFFKGVKGEGAAKLIEVNLETDTVREVYEFPQWLIQKNSYLNDVRVDTNRDVAYISDSGIGGIIVLDLISESSFRVLQDHSSTRGNGTKITINGRTWKRPDGTIPNVHVDGIALSPDGNTLYYHALSANTLYGIETEYLRQADLEGERGDRVKILADTGPADGMICDDEGNLYITALEDSGIQIYTPDGTLYSADLEDELQWPDSLAIGPDDNLYVTTSKIHLGENPSEPFGLYRLQLPLDLK